MTDENLDPITSVIAAHTRIGTEIARLVQECEAKTKPLAANLKRLEEYIDKTLPSGATKLVTPCGIAERKILESVSVSDWIGFTSSINRTALLSVGLPLAENEIQALVLALDAIGLTRYCKRDVKKTECLEYQTQHGALPEGLSRYSRYKLSITPSKQKGYDSE